MWGSGKDKQDFAREIGGLEASNLMLRERLEEKDALIDKLQSQILSLQESILAMKNTDAYKAQKEFQLAENWIDNTDPEIRAKSERDRQFIGDYFSEIEKPIFKDAQDMTDMISMFNRGAGAPENDSVHENGES